MSKYSKNLAGLNLKVLVSPAVAYSDDATLAAFEQSASEGQIGVFAKDGTIQTIALVAGDEFVIVQKRDGGLNKTPLLKFDEIADVRLTEYEAPVKQVTTVGYNATAGDIGLDFTGASPTNALTFGVSARETTPGNQPFPVQEGYATVISTTADEYTVLAQIASQLNGDLDYQGLQPDRFVKAEILSNGAVTEFVEDPTVTNGSKTVTFAGNVTVTTGAHVKFEAIGGPVYRAAVGVTAGTTITLDRPYQGATKTEDVSATVDIAGTAAFTSGTTLLGVRLTALEDESHFVAVGSNGIYSAPVTGITAWKQGSGGGASVAELESVEGILFDGVGSTVNAAFKADYGQPSLFADATDDYDLIFIDLAVKAPLPAAGLPVYEQKQVQRIVLAVPESGTSPITNLETILGL